MPKSATIAGIFAVLLFSSPFRPSDAMAFTPIQKQDIGAVRSCEAQYDALVVKAKNALAHGERKEAITDLERAKSVLQRCSELRAPEEQQAQSPAQTGRIECLGCCPVG
jgi:hypothetical protein